MPRHNRHGPSMVSIISPDDLKKARKMQYVNLAATMIQLACSLAIILVVRYDLGGYWGGTCLAATPQYRWTCEYAYSLAVVSVCACFFMSFTQYLTMDCCGAGRLFEAMFDMLAFFWWLAGAITLTVRGSDANAAGVPEETSRTAVFALCWVCAGLFLILMCTNFALMHRLGKAYKAAGQDLQQIQLQQQKYATAPPYGHYPGGPGPAHADPQYAAYPPPWAAGAAAAPPAGPPPNYGHQAEWGPIPPPGYYPAAPPPASYPTAAGAAPANGDTVVTVTTTSSGPQQAAAATTATAAPAGASPSPYPVAAVAGPATPAYNRQDTPWPSTTNQAGAAARNTPQSVAEEV